ncbi:serine protease [Methylobacterium sp. SI9]|uniref:trypsin-like serine peptidase n=1 Tax=Methylobacterium guangdongense TaxID=3138811 RepID=UPI00313C6B6C
MTTLILLLNLVFSITASAQVVKSNDFSTNNVIDSIPQSETTSVVPFVNTDRRYGIDEGGSLLSFSEAEIAWLKSVTGLIKCVNPKTRRGTMASASIIENGGYITTAAHVIYRAKELGALDCQFAPASNPSPPRKVLINSSSNFQGSSSKRDKNDDDYAVLELANPIKGIIPIVRAPRSSVSLGSQIYMVSALAMYMKRQIKPNEPIVQKCMVRSVDLYKDNSSSQITYDCITTHGQSGSVVLHRRPTGKLEAVGIAIQSRTEHGRNEENIGAPFDNEKNAGIGVSIDGNLDVYFRMIDNINKGSDIGYHTDLTIKHRSTEIDYQTTLQISNMIGSALGTVACPGTENIAPLKVFATLVDHNDRIVMQAHPLLTKEGRIRQDINNCEFYNYEIPTIRTKLKFFDPGTVLGTRIPRDEPLRDFAIVRLASPLGHARPLNSAEQYHIDSDIEEVYIPANNVINSSAIPPDNNFTVRKCAPKLAQQESIYNGSILRTNCVWIADNAGSPVLRLKTSGNVEFVGIASHPPPFKFLKANISSQKITNTDVIILNGDFFRQFEWSGKQP